MNFLSGSMCLALSGTWERIQYVSTRNVLCCLFPWAAKRRSLRVLVRSFPHVGQLLIYPEQMHYSSLSYHRVYLFIMWFFFGLLMHFLSTKGNQAGVERQTFSNICYDSWHYITNKQKRRICIWGSVCDFRKPHVWLRLFFSLCFPWITLEPNRNDIGGTLLWFNSVKTPWISFVWCDTCAISEEGHW